MNKPSIMWSVSLIPMPGYEKTLAAMNGRRFNRFRT